MNRSASIAMLLLVGCAEEVSEADGLLLPSELPVEWDAAWNEAYDGLGALVPVDVMVYDGATGEPIEGVEVLVSTSEVDAALTTPLVLPVPVEGVLVVDDETAPDALWDASRDQYVAFDPELVPDASELVEELLLETDDGGIARLYLYVDAFPLTADDTFAELSVVVAMGDVEETFRLVPR